MRILFVSGSFNQGGAEFQILSLANLMKEHGNEVYVISLTNYDFYKDYLHNNNISFHCLKNNDWKIKRIFQLSKFIKTFQPDAIIAFLKNTSLSTILAKMLSGWKCRLLLGERTALVKPLRDFLHFAWWHYADIVTTNSVSKFEYFKRNFPFLRHKLSLVRNVYKMESFFPPLSSEEVFNKNFINIVFIGRLSPEKNIHKLIESFAIISDMRYNFKLHLFGDSRNQAYRNKLDDLIDRYKLKEKVIYWNAVPQEKLKNIYSKADLICILSDYEGFSNVLAESMMQGCIPMVSNIPENTQVVKPGLNGFVVDITNPYSIVEELEKFLKLDSNAIDSMRFHNKKIIQEFLNPDIIYQDYSQLLSGKK